MNMDKKKNPFRRKLCQRLRNHRGLTFAELLITLLILALSSAGMAGGVLFATEQYRASMVLSESKALCSTLSDSIKDALRNATDRPQADSHDPSFIAKDWRTGHSRIYALNAEGKKTDYGELWIGDPDADSAESHNKRMVSTAAYSRYNLQAKAQIQYEAAKNLFHVTLTIRDAQKARDVIVSRFDVFCLNPGV